MPTDTKVAIASTVIATVAVTVASVQAYVAWSGRKDQMKAVILAQLTTRCAEVIVAANRVVESFPRGIPVLATPKGISGLDRGLDRVSASREQTRTAIREMELSLEGFLMIAEAVDRPSRHNAEESFRVIADSFKYFDIQADVLILRPPEGREAELSAVIAINSEMEKRMKSVEAAAQGIRASVSANVGN